MLGGLPLAWAAVWEPNCACRRHYYRRRFMLSQLLTAYTFRITYTSTLDKLDSA